MEDTNKPTKKGTIIDEVHFKSINPYYFKEKTGYGIIEIGKRQDQVIQPWMFGHEETKAICLWLKNLPNLEPTKIMKKRIPRVHFASPGKDRWKERSRFFKGVAEAMASQWGDL